MNDEPETNSTDTNTISRLKGEVEYYEQLFDLMWKADQRGIKMWQEANPGNENVWPDRADLVCWLIEQVEGRKKNA